MASAGGDEPTGPPRPPRPQHRFAIPLPPPGHAVTVRIRGPNQAHVMVHRMQRPPGFHVHHRPAAPANSDALRAQEEHRRRAEDEFRREAARQKREQLTIAEAPEASLREEGCVSVEWAPVTVGSEGVQYQVHMSCGEKEEVVYSGLDTACEVSADKLLPGKTYSFTVEASTGEIQGNPSPASGVPIPALPPATPPHLKSSKQGKAALNVRWGAAETNGSPLLHYSLEWDQGEYTELYRGKQKSYRLNHKFPPAAKACFRVRAANAIGWSAYSDSHVFSVGASVPGAPAPPCVEGVGVTWACVRWDPPVDHGSPVSSYCLELDDPHSGYGFCPVHQGEGLSYRVSGLSRASAYRLRVAASNEKGSGPHSQPVAFTTHPDTPGPPSAPVLSGRAHPTSLCLSWQAPVDDGGAAVDCYVVELGVDGLQPRYTGPDLTCTVEHLRPGHAYSCRVSAHSPGGQGKWSRTATLKTPPTLPLPPQDLVTMGDPLSDSVRLQWGRPECGGGSPVLSYSLEKSSTKEEGSWEGVAVVADDEAFSPSEAHSLPPLSHTITHLTPASCYFFRVNCRSAIGPSLTHGSAVTGYQLQFGLRACEQVTLVQSEGVECVKVLKGLVPASAYEVCLRALSGSGHSPWSQPLGFETTPSIPGAPLHLSVISYSPTSVLLGWAVPHLSGSPVTSYTLEVTQDQGSAHSRDQSSAHLRELSVDASQTQFTVSKLQPETKYKMRVQACCAHGLGPFCPHITVSTLPLPPPPPSLTLVSVSSQSLKLSWGKRPSRDKEFILQSAAPGKTFSTVFRGAGVSYRLSKLAVASSYTLRIAAASLSGQGAWSEPITFTTTPIPPSPPTGLALHQMSSTQVFASWSSVSDGLPVQEALLVYEVQARRVGGDYEQVYRGSSSSCSIPTDPTCAGVEVRVRCVMRCGVNGVEETLWGPYSPPTLHTPLQEEEEGGEGEGEVEERREEVEQGGGEVWREGRVLVMCVLMAVIGLALALLLGHLM